MIPIPQQMPQVNVTMDGLIPTMGDMTPVVESIKKIDDTLNAFRNDKIFGIVKQYQRSATEAVEESWAEFQRQTKEITAVPAANASQAGAQAAELILLLEERARYVENITLRLATPVQTKVKSRFNVEDLLSPGVWLHSAFNLTFNHSTPKTQTIEGHRSGSLTEMGEQDCQEFEKMLMHMAWLEKCDQTMLDWIKSSWNTSNQSIITSPVVMQAPDIITKFQVWAQVSGEHQIRVGEQYVENSKEVSRLSLRLLNDVAGCEINEEQVARGASASLRPATLALTITSALAVMLARIGL